MMCTLIFNCNNARAYLQSRYKCISKYMTKNYISRSAKTTFNLERKKYYIGTNYIYTRQLSGTEWDQWLMEMKLITFFKLNKLNLYPKFQLNDPSPYHFSYQTHVISATTFGPRTRHEQTTYYLTNIFHLCRCCFAPPDPESLKQTKHGLSIVC